MDAGTNLTPSNTMDNSIGQVVPFNDPYQEPTDLITAQAGGGQEGQKTPDDVFSADGKSIEERCEDCELPISYCDRLRGVRHAPREGGSGRYALDCDRCGEMYESCPECNGDICFDCHNDVCIFCGCNTLKYAAESFSEAGLELRNAGRCGCEQDDLWEVVNVESPVFLCSTCGYAGNKKEDGHFMHMKNIWNAESKFIRPYDGRHGFNPKRDNKGRYRRKLVVPLAKGAESLVEEPDWIPAGDGRALGQQNLDINLSPLHAEGNLKDYNPITLVVLGIIGGIGVALGAQSLVK